MEKDEKNIVEEEVVKEENIETEDKSVSSDEEKKDDTAKESVEESVKKDEKKSFFKKKEDPEKVKLQQENEMLKDKYLRVNAEMQNMRRRMEEEKSNLLKYEGEGLIKKLLPIVDNFERAISMDDTNLEDEVSKFLSGFKMIYGNLSNTLKDNDIVVMDVLNTPFDPNTMEAVLTEEVEGVEPNIVIDVLQKGYTYKGKVIRHAMVKVSK